MSEEAPNEQEQPTEVAQEQAQPQQQPTGPSKEELAELVSGAVSQQFDQREQRKEMTPEERAEHYRVWNPDPEFAESFRAAVVSEDATPEQRLKAFSRMRDGIMEQAYRGAELIARQLLDQQQQQMGPLLHAAAQVQREQTWNNFASKYPALSEQRELVDAIATQLSQSGYRPKSEQEAIEKVAKTAEAYLKKANPQFSLQNQTTASGMPKMAGTSMPGGSPGRAPAPVKRGQLAPFFQD